MTTIQPIDYTVNIAKALIWQYNEASNITNLINLKQEWYTEYQTQFWQDWFNNVFWLWNPTPLGEPGAFTEFGAAVWSIILGIPLQIGPEPFPDDAQVFSFDGSDSFPNWNFDNGGFTNGGSSIQLTLQDKVLILQLRYFQLITRGAVPEVNAFLQKAFEFYGYDGDVFVRDGLNMTCQYIFTTPISVNLQYILENFDILPRPAGVELYIVVDPYELFGFDSLGSNMNFDNGAFIQGY
jgi:hypothetical protein